MGIMDASLIRRCGCGGNRKVGHTQNSGTVCVIFNAGDLSR